MLKNFNPIQTIMREIQLPKKILQNLLHHAQQNPEQEVCGLISCDEQQHYQSYPIENNAAQPSHFFNLEPQQHIQAVATMRENKQHLFAIYHSHPTAPAIPSSTDLDNANYPDALYFIISLNIKGVLEVRGYQLQQQQFVEVALSLL